MVIRRKFTERIGGWMKYKYYDWLKLKTPSTATTQNNNNNNNNNGDKKFNQQKQGNPNTQKIIVNPLITKIKGSDE